MDRKIEELPVLPTTAWVVERARDVRIVFKEETLEKLAEEFKKFKSQEIPEQRLLHLVEVSPEESARWIFVLDTLNYCFWPDKGELPWSIFYKGKEWSGYWALAGSLKRAYEEHIPVTKASFIANIKEEELRYIFRGKGEIPLFESRLNNLREAGRVLLERWDGDFVNVIKHAGRKATKLVRTVVEEFSSFQDEAFYDGKRIFFWKRAQLLVSDLNLFLGGKDLGTFEDLNPWGEQKHGNLLTAFADYKLPQVLRALGILEYSEKLSEKIDNFVYLLPGEREEVEIRASTVQAVELIRKVFETYIGKTIYSTEVDNFLWHLGQKEEFRQKPYHRCRTIYY